MYSSTGLRSISLQSSQERPGKRPAGLTPADAPRPALLVEMGRGSEDGDTEIQRKKQVERSFRLFFHNLEAARERRFVVG
jgi:hypothetical protein